ncbi:Crp/Fnr family transcriptional regulator [Sphingomonas psychrotolerans]|uniref:Crp/Fnr family transcriptional regulator n=1 Tax=Sphingomonas psychrotolerans TaxID=1327635 RepID=A0ABU3N8Q3_9SPHN|nr:Crp/Fnr family transcriptional regulator [Sphingomonas psychrotolerans]MDT8760879.1 Crp/Fnr family transcriptional regulator [Sphingomonas psychrotolerans]
MYPIHRWQAFASLTDKEQEALVTLAEVEETRGPGEIIRMEGDVASGFYLHLRGWVTSSILLRSGARLIQKVHLPGDLLGTPSMVLPRAADTLTAITAATVAFVPFQRLGVIYSHLPRLGALITFAAQVERLALMDALVVAGRASAKEQLARLLLDLHARLTPLGAAEDNAFDLPLTQEAIGDLTGLTAIHVNRKLRELREEGLIAFQRGRMQILDLAALRALAPIEPRLLQFEPAWLPPPE